MAETQTRDLYREGLILFNCDREFTQLSSIELDLTAFIEAHAPDLIAAYKKRAEARLEALLPESSGTPGPDHLPILG